MDGDTQSTPFLRLFKARSSNKDTLIDKTDSTSNHQKDTSSIMTKTSNCLENSNSNAIAHNTTPLRHKKSFFTLRMFRDKINGKENDIDCKTSDLFVDAPKLSCVENDISLSPLLLSDSMVDVRLTSNDIKDLHVEGNIASTTEQSYNTGTGTCTFSENNEQVDMVLNSNPVSMTTDPTTIDVNHELSELNEIRIKVSNDTTNEFKLIEGDIAGEPDSTVVYNANVEDAVVEAQPNKTKILTQEVPRPETVSLFIGDLAKTITEMDLKESFDKYPGLLSVKIPLDSATGISLGYAYVNYNNKENASKATEALNYTYVKDSEIRIMPSLRDKDERERIGANVFMSNLPSNMTTREIFDKFKTYGKVLSCKWIPNKVQAFIHFESKEVAYNVVKEFNHSVLNGKLIYAGIHILKKDRKLFGTTKAAKTARTDNSGKVTETISTPTTQGQTQTQTLPPTPFSNQNFYSAPHSQPRGFIAPATHLIKPSTLTESPNWPVQRDSQSNISTRYSIFIRNLPLDISDSTIYSLVEPYGQVLSVLSRKVPKRNGAWALVTLTNQESVDKAILNLNTLEIDSHKLFITRAIPKEEKGYYIQKIDNTPKMKLKILITGLNVNLHKEQFEEWCASFGSIIAVELYGTASKCENEEFTAYGYVEMSNEDDADKLIENLTEIGVNSFKVRIEIPRYSRPQVPQYPYISKGDPTAELPSANSIPVSYVDPSKMLEIAMFNKDVEVDKLSYIHPNSVLKNRSNNDKRQNGRRNNFNNDNNFSAEINDYEEENFRGNKSYRNNTRSPKLNPTELMKRIHTSMGNFAVSILSPQITYDNLSTNLTKLKIRCLTEHIVKFHFGNEPENLFEMLERVNRGYIEPTKLLRDYLVEAGSYLGIINS